MEILNEPTLNKFTGRGLVELFDQVTKKKENMVNLYHGNVKGIDTPSTIEFSEIEQLIHYKWKIAKIMADRMDG